MSEDIYRNKVRVRVNGILVQSSCILMVRIKSPVTGDLVWMPPGGGLEFGETLDKCLIREFREETGLHVITDEFLFLDELVEESFHAVELYFKVTQTGGKVKLGKDPEHDSDSQVINDIQWVPLSSLSNLTVAPKKLIANLDQIKF